MTTPGDLRKRLKACPPGTGGWKQFENICIETLTYLFVPPLKQPKIQPRTFSGIDRRDAVFPNRNLAGDNNWGYLYQELDARLILFEFKNYDMTEIGKDETNQTRNYLTKGMGRLGIMCCNRKPNDAAHIKRNSIFSEDEKVILFITVENLLEMIDIKDRGEDPSDFILDLIEHFYLQHE
jgi:hypothetical protein